MNREERDALIETQLITNRLPKLSTDEKVHCEFDVTPVLCGEALKALKNGKTPGTDGLTADFYKFFGGRCERSGYGVTSIRISQRRTEYIPEARDYIINTLKR